MINTFTHRKFEDLPDIDKINLLAQESELNDSQFMTAIAELEVGSEEEVTRLAAILESHRPELSKRLSQNMK